jgi:hypothetical protein
MKVRLTIIILPLDAAKKIVGKIEHREIKAGSKQYLKGCSKWPSPSAIYTSEPRENIKQV